MVLSCFTHLLNSGQDSAAFGWTERVSPAILRLRLTLLPISDQLNLLQRCICNKNALMSKYWRMSRPPRSLYWNLIFATTLKKLILRHKIFLFFLGWKWLVITGTGTCQARLRGLLSPGFPRTICELTDYLVSNNCFGGTSSDTSPIAFYTKTQSKHITSFLVTWK